MEKQRILYLQNKVAYLRDEDAYKEIFIHFHPRLFKIGQNIIRNTDDCEDIVSDVLLKIWTMENKLAYINDLDIYLFKALKNTALNYLSKNNKTVRLDEHQEVFSNITTNNTESSTYNKETTRLLENAVSALPPQRQMVFRLVREEGMTYKQVGAILEISQNTIETHMRLALKDIKQLLDKYLTDKL